MRFFTICLMFCLGGCLRPVWTEAPRTSAAAPVVEQRELYASPYDDEDRYQIAFDDQMASSSRIVLLVNMGEYYAMDCHWRGNTCTDWLPRGARHAHVLLIHDDSYRRCPTFRVMREEVTLEITQPFQFGCAFVLRSNP
jgi:hypothetical protein